MALILSSEICSKTTKKSMTTCDFVCAGFWVCRSSLCVGGCSASCWRSWSCEGDPALRNHSRQKVKEGTSWWRMWKDRRMFRPKKKKWMASRPEESQQEKGGKERWKAAGQKREFRKFLKMVGSCYDTKASSYRACLVFLLSFV